MQATIPVQIDFEDFVEELREEQIFDLFQYMVSVSYETELARMFAHLVNEFALNDDEPMTVDEAIAYYKKLVVEHIPVDKKKWSD